MRSLLTALLLLLSLFSIAASQTGTVKLEGQVVCCADCWAEADRTKVEFGTAEDLLKAKSCVEGGDPTLIAVREGDEFTLYQLEQGKFRIAGKNWLEYVGKRVAVTGTVRMKKDASAIPGQVTAFHSENLERGAMGRDRRAALNIPRTFEVHCTYT